MNLHRILLRSVIIPVFLLFPALCPVGEAVSVGGYNKIFLTGPLLSGSSQESVMSLSNRFRIKFEAGDPGPVSFGAAYSITPLISDSSIVSSRAQPYNYRISDINSPFAGNSKDFAVYQNLDRLFVKYKAGAADVYFGRQAVAWGSAKAVNPTDVFIPFRFDELDKEERTGVDALRIRYTSGAMSELDAGCVFGRDMLPSENSFFARDKMYICGVDVTAMLADFRKNLLVGADLAGSIGGAGAWIEAAYAVPRYFDDCARDPADEYLRFTTGCDYSFGGRFYGYAEYHFNGAGAEKTEDYSSVLLKTAYTEGAAYLTGRHYIMPGFVYQFTPLVNLGMLNIINMTDGSVLAAPNLEYNFHENFYFSLGAFEGFGGETLSEFGEYSGIYFSSVRYYF
ncbi:MAG: hypothetical protein ABII64_01560 [Elusimicrobiota bacterium]